MERFLAIQILQKRSSWPTLFNEANAMARHLHCSGLMCHNVHIQAFIATPIVTVTSTQLANPYTQSTSQSRCPHTAYRAVTHVAVWSAAINVGQC